MQHKIRSGLVSLLQNDAYLLGIDVNERTLTHRLGTYYAALFPEWDVDCEYNKHFDRPKEVELDIHQMLARMADLLRSRQIQVVKDLSGRLVNRKLENEEIANLERQLQNPNLKYDAEKDMWIFLLQLLSGETVYKPVVPDIIVHKRGVKNNLVAIEAKKTSSTNIASREYDLLKLQALITDKRYSYRYGYFLDLPVKSDLLAHKKFTFLHDAYEPRVLLATP